MNRNSANPPVMTPRWHYGRPAILLHWLLAVLIAGQLALGLYMMSIADDPGSERYFNLHMAIGLIIGALVVLRLAWRLTHKPADLPGSVAPWEVKASRTVQWLLYACMLAMPVTGYLGASFSKEGIAFAGLSLSRWASANEDISKQFFAMHFLIEAILVVLVGIHVLGGLKHLLIDKDGVFQRMWF
jgi:cytochrome b561